MTDRPAPRRSRGTATSTFGVSRRESHDATTFYRRGIASSTFSTDTDVDDVPARVRNRVFEHTSETMHELPDNSVALMVTSPPYHVGKDYDTDTSYPEFLELLQRIFEEVHRVLEPGGRAAVNVANLGRKPYVPFSHHVTSIMTAIGFPMRGEIIWRKAAGAGGSCAFGSWKSATNPVLRDVHEVHPRLLQRPDGPGSARGLDDHRGRFPAGHGVDLGHARRISTKGWPSRAIPGGAPAVSSSCTPSPATSSSTHDGRRLHRRGRRRN